MVTVQVSVQGNETKAVQVNKGEALSKVLEALGLTITGFTVMFNGVAVSDPSKIRVDADSKVIAAGARDNG